MPNTAPPEPNTYGTTSRVVQCHTCGASVVVPVLTGYAVPWNNSLVSCPTCAARESAAEARRRECERLDQRITELVALGDYSDATRRCWFKRSNPAVESRNPTAWQAIRAWDGGQNLFLFGPPGTGKTHAARCILNRWLARRRTVAEISSRRVFKADRLFDDRGALKRWQAVDVLLLDDIDKARWTEDALGALWELVDARCSNDVRTICTANVAWPALGELLAAGSPHNSALAESIASRISPAKLEFAGDDLRRVN